MPTTPARKDNLHRIDLLQPALLKCVFAQTQHPMPCTPACKSNLHPIASISSFEVYLETAAHDKLHNCSSCVYIFPILQHILLMVGKVGLLLLFCSIYETFTSGRHFRLEPHSAHDVNRCKWIWSPVPWRPKLTYDEPMYGCTIHHSTQHQRTC